MEDKEPTVGLLSSNIKQFLVMWGQTAGIFGVAVLIILGVLCVVLGVYTLLKVAGLLFGTIIFFVLATLGVTIWGWMSGERP